MRILALDKPRGLHRVVLSVAVTARRAVYSNFELSALCSRYVTKWRRVLPPAGVALIADPLGYRIEGRFGAILK
jgi:hypothetical protein